MLLPVPASSQPALAPRLYFPPDPPPTNLWPARCTATPRDVFCGLARRCILVPEIEANRYCWTSPFLDPRQIQPAAIQTSLGYPSAHSRPSTNLACFPRTRDARSASRRSSPAPRESGGCAACHHGYAHVWPSPQDRSPRNRSTSDRRKPDLRLARIDSEVAETIPSQLASCAGPACPASRTIASVADPLRARAAACSPVARHPRATPATTAALTGRIQNPSPASAQCHARSPAHIGDCSPAPKPGPLILLPLASSR